MVGRDTPEPIRLGRLCNSACYFCDVRLRSSNQESPKALAMGSVKLLRITGIPCRDNLPSGVSISGGKSPLSGICQLHCRGPLRLRRPLLRSAPCRRNPLCSRPLCEAHRRGSETLRGAGTAPAFAGQISCRHAPADGAGPISRIPFCCRICQLYVHVFWSPL